MCVPSFGVDTYRLTNAHRSICGLGTRGRGTIAAPPWLKRQVSSLIAGGCTPSPRLRERVPERISEHTWPSTSTSVPPKEKTRTNTAETGGDGERTAPTCLPMPLPTSGSITPRAADWAVPRSAGRRSWSDFGGACRGLRLRRIIRALRIATPTPVSNTRPRRCGRCTRSFLHEVLKAIGL